MHPTERERLERDIANHRRELRAALRDLSFSLVLVNLPQRIKRHPFLWATAAAGIGTWLGMRAHRQRIAHLRIPRKRRGARA